MLEEEKDTEQEEGRTELENESEPSPPSLEDLDIDTFC